MLTLTVDIVRFADAYQPGIVECQFNDAWGNQHLFIDKLPLFTTDDLSEASSYPQPGVIACTIIKRWQDLQGRELVTIDTNQPWLIESTAEQTQFDVLPSQLTGLEI